MCSRHFRILVVIFLLFQHSDKYTIFYSTPSCYLKAFSEEKKVKLVHKYDDFFPYGVSGPGYNGIAYWSGYLTTKPGIKGLIRMTSSLLQVRVALADPDFRIPKS